MNLKYTSSLAVTVATGIGLFVVSLLASAQQAEQAQGAPPPVPAEELPAGSQILASGPVHEAFAKPVSMEPQAPIIVQSQPPPNLQEMPPAERPAGASVVWVPGYWAWDTDRKDFIWVSGCWRNAPPNTYWVPGHWLQVDTGWEWVAGFWRPIAAQPQQEIEYLPAPPAVVEVEPPGPPPSADQIWVPGCWYWVDGQFVIRHGYWTTPQVGWVWMPSHYAWTPRGYIFCPGHWDYDLDNRGVLFAPAYFPPAARVQIGFVYSPSVCVDLGVLQLNLFACPQYHHYYFGDYYDDAYRHVGIYPWYQCQTVHSWYDPLFVYNRWCYRRSDPHWADDQARQFALLRSNRDLRPPRTFADQQAQMNRLPADRRNERPLVEPVKTYAASQSTPTKFERLTMVERQQIAEKSTDVHNLRDQRNHWEAPPAQPKPTREIAANPPVLRPTTTPVQVTKRPDIAPSQSVRVTQAEREVVTNPPRAAKPADSRYIEKQPPRGPAEEHSHVESTSPRGASDRDSQHGSRSGDSSSKDQQR